MTASMEHVDVMHDHWWWRPGWRVGRRFHACHFTMEQHAGLAKLVAQYQAALRDFPGLDLIPKRWLHLTMQGIGFVDELNDDAVTVLAATIRQRLAEVPPPVVTFHRPVIRPEAVYLPAEPAAPVAAVRTAVRTAINAVLGPDLAELAAKTVQTYRPHVSIAYSNTEQAAEPVARALSSVDAARVTVTLDHVDLLTFHRDHRMYEWTSARPIRISR